MKVDVNTYTERQQLIAKYSNALGNPIRVAILELLSSDKCCYHGDMFSHLPVAKSTLSQHLKVLSDSGLIQGDADPPKTKYCINRESWGLAKGLLLGFFD